MGASAIAKANVWVGAPEMNILPAPEITIIKDKNNISYLNIDSFPADAQYILVRLNGFDLGYAELGDKIRIGELKYTDDELLEFAFMDGDYNVGETVSVVASSIGIDESIGFDMGNFEKPNADNDPGYNVEPVATGVNLSAGDCLALIGVSLFIVSLFFAYKKDARRKGGRPREGP